MKYKPMHRNMERAFAEWSRSIQVVNEKFDREHQALRIARKKAFDEQGESDYERIQQKYAPEFAKANAKWHKIIDSMDYSTGKKKLTRKSVTLKRRMSHA